MGILRYGLEKFQLIKNRKQVQGGQKKAMKLSFSIFVVCIAGIFSCNSQIIDENTIQLPITRILLLKNKAITDNEILNSIFPGAKIYHNTDYSYDELLLGYFTDADGGKLPVDAISVWIDYNVPFNPEDPSDDRYYDELTYFARIVGRFPFMQNDTPHILVKAVVNHNEETVCGGCSLKVLYVVMKYKNSGSWSVVDKLETYESSMTTVSHEFVKISDYHVALANEHFHREGSSLNFIALIDNKLKNIQIGTANDGEVGEESFFSESIEMYCDDETGTKFSDPDEPCYRYTAKFHFDKMENPYNLIIERREVYSGKEQTKVYMLNDNKFILSSVKEK
jgi:hypothetical protein